jgi:peptidoglycan/LPS O-acetylase OafA/YrhL
VRDAKPPNLLDSLRRENSLNAVRLVLASMVLVAHSWPLSGLGQDPAIGGEHAGPLAVAGFFAVSGYLIAGSRLRLSLPQFAWNRLLRIYPGYWTVVVVIGLVLAPLASWVVGEHWTLHAGLHYTLAVRGGRSATPRVRLCTTRP